MVTNQKQILIKVIALMLHIPIVCTLPVRGTYESVEAEANTVALYGLSGEMVKVTAGTVRYIHNQLCSIIGKDVVITLGTETLYADDPRVIDPGTILNFVNSYEPSDPLQFIDWVVLRAQGSKGPRDRSCDIDYYFDLLYRADQGVIDITIKHQIRIDTLFSYSKSYPCDGMRPMQEWFYDECAHGGYQRGKPEYVGLDLITYLTEQKAFKPPSEDTGPSGYRDIFNDPSGDSDSDETDSDSEENKDIKRINKILNKLPEEYRHNPVIQFIAKESEHYEEEYRGTVDLIFYKVVSTPHSFSIHCISGSTCDFKPQHKGISLFFKDVYHLLRANYIAPVDV